MVNAWKRTINVLGSLDGYASHRKPNNSGYKSRVGFWRSIYGTSWWKSKDTLRNRVKNLGASRPTGVIHRVGYNNSAIPDSKLVPTLVTSIYAYMKNDSYQNHFDRPVYINGTLLSDSTDVRKNYQFLINLYNSGNHTYKCYVKSS